MRRERPDPPSGAEDGPVRGAPVAEPAARSVRSAARRRAAQQATRTAVAASLSGRPTDSESSALVVRVDPAAGRVTLTGPLVGGSIPVLHAAVSTVLRSRRTNWSIDVSELLVTDDAGLRAIVGAYRRALRHGRQLTLLGASPPLRRALTRLRLASHLLPGDELRPSSPPYR